MPEKIAVRDGECVPGIAIRQGLLPDTIWNHPDNEELREKRESMYSLLDGEDQLFVPEIRVREEAVPVNHRTTFVRKGIPETLRIHFRDPGGRPRASLKYLFEIGDEARSGTLSTEGLLEERVSPGCRSATITLEDEYGREVYEVFVSHLDPASEICGAQQRLMNLGYDCAGEYGSYGPVTEAALVAFQRDHGLPITGVPDRETLLQINAVYGR